MAFQLSPGVNVTEVDLTTIVPSVSSSIGAFVGVFEWGPVEEIITITNELRLVERFGKPNNTNFKYWFSAANFLSYSNNLKVIRANNSGILNSTTGATAALVKNRNTYDASFSGGANTFGEFAAKYPGELGNSLRVEMADANTLSGWVYAADFSSNANTSLYTSTTANNSNARDEVHVVVIDRLGRFTGVPNTVLETFPFLSKASDARNEIGESIYYKNVLNDRSNYVWSLSHPENTAGSGSNWGTAATDSNVSTNGYKLLTSRVAKNLANGVNGTISNTSVQNAYSVFANSDQTDISLIISGPADAPTAKYIIQNVAEVRKDCLVFVSPEESDVLNRPAGSELTDVLGFRNDLASSSYAVMDSGYKYQYDKYNDVYRWVPLNGDIAGLCARTDLERDPWFSPAGSNRGIIKNVIKLAWNPSKSERDDLYLKGVNPVVTFSGEGTMLYGDKTLLSRPSAFDRINVRRLFIVLEKAISIASRSSLFEFNDQFTRAQFVNLIEPYLRDIQGRRGITDFRVVCDERNNTPEVVDRNEFVGDIFIKPARSTNYIQLNFVAVRSGVSFDEIVGRQI